MDIKVSWENLSRKIYLNRLPKKRMGAGCLFFDEQGKMLILKPIYKNHWLLPGGVVENNESPRQACIREVKEEIGLDRQPIRLLCIDYVSDRIHQIESVQFVFLGGIISHETQIYLPEAEISTYQFLEPSMALSMLGVRSQRRLEQCLAHLDDPIVVYLENGEQP